MSDLGETEVPISALQKGDVIEVRVGEKIPVDGVVVNGEAHVDESAMTGESELVLKTTGDKVLSGTIVKDAVIRFKATQVGKDTVLSNMIRMVQEAQGSKAPVQRVVDKVALVFVPVVGGIALLTFLLWYFLGETSRRPSFRLSVCWSLPVLVQWDWLRPRR